MINIDLKPLLKGDMSRYALVVGVAKRSREITDKANEEKEILIEQPVSLAIRDFMDGECYIEIPAEDK